MATPDQVRPYLEQIRALNPSDIIRREDLGKTLNFSGAEVPVRAQIGLFSEIPGPALHDLPENMLETVHSQANRFLEVYSRALHFNENQQNPLAERNGIIGQLFSTFNEAYERLSPISAFIRLGSATGGQSELLSKKARAFELELDSRLADAKRSIADYEAEAKRILQEIKSVAAEQGVTQQAYYYKTESENHSKQAEKWEKRVKWLAGIALAYLCSALIVFKIPLLTPTSTYDAAQLSISKALVFTVLAYLLFLCAKNFLAHEHNAVVNRHRQNALLTFKSLAEAAGSSENRDIVLTHAASCIFSPQDTGYMKGSPQTNITGFVENASKLLTPP